MFFLVHYLPLLVSRKQHRREFLKRDQSIFTFLGVKSTHDIFLFTDVSISKTRTDLLRFLNWMCAARLVIVRRSHLKIMAWNNIWILKTVLPPSVWAEVWLLWDCLDFFCNRCCRYWIFPKIGIYGCVLEFSACEGSFVFNWPYSGIMYSDLSRVAIPTERLFHFGNNPCREFKATSSLRSSYVFS